MTTTAERAPAVVGSWASTPLSPKTTWHRVPQAGLPGYAEPEADGEVTQSLPGGAQVGLVKTQDSWAQVVYGGTTTWVDGQALNPPALGAAPSPTSSATRSSSTRTSRTSSTAPIDVWSAVGALAGIGIIVGAIVHWIQGPIGINSFDLPMKILFDKSASLDGQPRIGYFLIALGLLAIFASLKPDLTLLRRLAGALTLVIAVLFCYQIQDSIVFGHVNFTDIVSVGPWIVGACGLVLTLVPAPRRYR
jgi:hypothetical protein